MGFHEELRVETGDSLDHPAVSMQSLLGQRSGMGTSPQETLRSEMDDATLVERMETSMDGSYDSEDHFRPGCTYVLEEKLQSRPCAGGRGSCW